MSLYSEISYAKIVGQQLERFKIKKESPFAANARCPVCGDSSKSKTKARFHILEKSGKLMCYCHNCTYSNSFVFFIKTYHHSVYKEFIFDEYRQNTGPVITTPSKPTEVVPRINQNAVGATITLGIPLVSSLPEEHAVRRYVASRKLPEYPFMVTDRFYAFSSQFNEDIVYNEGDKDELRLIIPFYDRKGNIFAYQGRDMSGKSAQKYITIMINKKIPKIFGIDRLDVKKPVIIVEGPIDSLFLPNCLASVSASLVATAEKLSSVLDKKATTLVFDNEPRNKTIVGMYREAINTGYRIVLWPKKCDGIKDINDCVLAGINPEKIIFENTFSGLGALIKFNEWKRI